MCCAAVKVQNKDVLKMIMHLSSVTSCMTLHVNITCFNLLSCTIASNLEIKTSKNVHLVCLQIALQDAVKIYHGYKGVYLT